MSVETELLRPAPDGGLARAAGAGFTMAEPHQLGVLSGACNECSNCEVYCPEHGAPFLVKERVFLNRADVDASPGLDGFWQEDDTLRARLNGIELALRVDPSGRRGVVTGDGVELELTLQPVEITGGRLSGPAPEIDTALLHRMVTVWQAVFRSPTVTMVSPA